MKCAELAAEVGLCKLYFGVLQQATIPPAPETPEVPPLRAAVLGGSSPKVRWDPCLDCGNGLG